MGQITIEVPQKLNKTYRIISEDSAKEVLDKLEVMVKKANHVKKKGLLGLWADREESAEEIARELRRKSNNRHLRNG
jgi:L-lactate utilization protein LutB